MDIKAYVQDNIIPMDREYQSWGCANPMTYSEGLEWIEALRSGEYQQATGKLKGTNIHGETRFCCLGVEQHIHPEQCALVNSDATLYVRGVGEQRLPDTWQGGLANLNDNNVTFEEISNVIETYILPWIAFYESFSVTQGN